MTVRLLLPFDGYGINQIVDLDRATEAALVSQQRASFDLDIGYVAPPVDVFQTVSSVRYFPLQSGVWVSAPSLFRVRTNGVGTVTFDAADALGAIRTGVASITEIGGDNEISYPYLGETAVYMRATFPTTITVEVLT